MFASGKAATVSGPANYIEDVFSTYLYTGNNGALTITNGIDLSTKGGMVWIKNRGTAADNDVTDTVRGARKPLFTNSTAAQDNNVDYAVNSFLTTGFTLSSSDVLVNALNNTYASWSFAKTPKFFDVVTWSGDDAANRQISHSLGSVPGCIIVKRTDASATWRVWHQNMVSNSANLYLNQLNLNTTNAVNLTYGEVWGTSNNVTSTTFQVGSLAAVNATGGTYVAYLFAHNAGGFGLTGTDNVISCGSYTGNGSSTGPTVTLGYEPQWVMIKNASNTGDWVMFDSMRGLTVGDGDAYLYANTSAAESTGATRVGPSATGFYLKTVASNLNTSGDTYIYIAIRRGPMKVPTDATKVFAPVTYTGNGSSQSLTAGFPISLGMFKYRGGATNSFEWFDRLRGTSPELRSAYNYAELATTTEVTSFASNTQVTVGASSDTGGTNVSGQTYVLEAFQRAPSFFDEVCYTGTGSATTVTHNLGVVPELMIVKARSIDGAFWVVYSATLGNTKNLYLQTDGGQVSGSALWNSTTPTSTVFSIGSNLNVNRSADTYVAYLFATCAGVSKVGSYTGNGTTQAIACGFTGGARFVLIKRTDSTGGWYVYDTARGMTLLTDPYLFLNSTAAESATLGSVITSTGGFTVDATILAAINTNGASYIYLSIA